MNNYRANILVIDDEKDVLKTLKDTLTREGFTVETAATGQQGLDSARAHTPDLIILDLRLPDIDGYDVCRILKSEPTTMSVPIIMLSTRAQDTEKILGLELGGDDYLTKPYNPLELIARIRVALRRRKPETALPTPLASPVIIESGDVSVNIEHRVATVNRQTLKLTRKEFELLTAFLEKPGKVFSRNALLERIWGNAYDSLQGTVDTHIKTLRKKLGNAAHRLETVTGIGYRWSTDEEQ